jgi:UTP--glucose-1-phosphate uridylyltransferase
MEVAPESVSSYGIAALDPDRRPVSVGQSVQIQDLVEKPSPTTAPSRLAVVGRYLCSVDVFDHLRRTAPGSGGEIQFTDALAALATSHGLYGCISDLPRVDVGNRAGLAAASALIPPWEG